MPFFFWANTDDDWEEAGGANWRDAANGGGNPSGQPGAADVIVIEKDCTTNADHSAVTFGQLDVEEGITLTVANGGDVRFDDDGTFDGQLAIQVGGNVWFTDADWTINSSGNIDVDGTLRMVCTANHYLYWEAANSITGSGTIELSGAGANQCRIQSAANGASIVGDATPDRLVFDGNVGAVKQAAVNINADYCEIEKLEAVDCASLVYKRAAVSIGLIIDDVIVRDCEDGVLDTGSGPMYVDFRDSWVYGNDAFGLIPSGVWICTDVVFGQNEAVGADANATADVGCFTIITQTAFYARLRNCLLASPTEVEFNASNQRCIVHSSSHDTDAEIFKAFIGIGDPPTIIESEFATTQGASRQSIQIVTDANVAADAIRRIDWPLTVWPATHGDTLDVTVYVYGTLGDKIWVIVDPDSHYGTSQSDEYTILANSTWEQITVPQYTVNTNADEKMGIPIIVRIEEASNTYYVDTLAVNGVSIPMDNSAYDGRMAVPIGSGAGGLNFIPGRRSTLIGR